jgi:iron complex transport system ATP-binding protein
MIQIENISYRAGGRTILDQVSFTVPPGAITVVLGANGAGKSTLLRLVSGELQPKTGRIVFNGQLMHQVPPAQLALNRAVLTQQYAVNLPFTCEEVVMMGRYPHFSNKPAAADHEVVQEVMADLHVTHLQARLFQTLSGGEQQRIQLARVLAQLRDAAGTTPNTRKLLLLDEPTSSMDWLHQQLALQKARQLAQQGYGILVILHDLNLAAQFADQLVLLRQGKLIATGTPFEVLQPATIYMAYGIETDLLQQNDYPFPVIIPSLPKQGADKFPLSKTGFPKG